VASIGQTGWITRHRTNLANFQADDLHFQDTVSLVKLKFDQRPDFRLSQGRCPHPNRKITRLGKRFIQSVGLVADDHRMVDIHGLLLMPQGMPGLI
jgi:hypothetical protein